MSTPTDSRPELITVIAYMRAKGGKEQELRDALLGLVGPTSQEQGFVNYDLHQDISDPTFFAMYENWETVALHDTHMQARHLQDFANRLDDLLDGPLNVHQMRRIS